MNLELCQDGEQWRVTFFCDVCGSAMHFTAALPVPARVFLKTYIPGLKDIQKGGAIKIMEVEGPSALCSKCRTLADPQQLQLEGGKDAQDSTSI